MMMFSINPAYDFEKGDELGIGTVRERAALFRRCEAEGVGISVMKPFHGGQLLSAAFPHIVENAVRADLLEVALLVDAVQEPEICVIGAERLHLPREGASDLGKIARPAVFARGVIDRAEVELKIYLFPFPADGAPERLVYARAARVQIEKS